MSLRQDLPFAAAALGWLALALSLAWLGRARRAAERGAFFGSGAQQHLWLGAAVIVAFVWSIQVRALAGLEVGLLGSALVALLLGPWRGALALLLALGVFNVLAPGSWRNFGLNGWLLGALPCLLAGTLQAAIARWLPRNVFVFMLGNGLFVVLLTTAVVGLARIGLALVLAPAGVELQAGDAAAYALLLAWGEALLSGMLFCALVIYFPHLVRTYDQDVYLPRRGARPHDPQA